MSAAIHNVAATPRTTRERALRAASATAARSPRSRTARAWRRRCPSRSRPKDIIAVLKSERGQNTVIQMKVDGGKDLLVMIKDYTLPPGRAHARARRLRRGEARSAVDVDIPLVATGKPRRRQRRHPPPGLPHGAGALPAGPHPAQDRGRRHGTSTSTSRIATKAPHAPRGRRGPPPAEQTVIAVVAPEKDRTEEEAAAAAPAAAAAAPAAAGAAAAGGKAPAAGAAAAGAKDAKKDDKKDDKKKK